MACGARSTECINGWRGLSPLALNPHFGTAPGITPAQQAPSSGRTGTTPSTCTAAIRTGFARSTWDNVGVQYGLQALRDGHLTPADFLDLNATIGGWKQPQDTVQEGCPYIATSCPADIDVWSARNINPVGPNGVAPRTRGASRR